MCINCSFYHRETKACTTCGFCGKKWIKNAFNIYLKPEYGDFIQEVYDQVVSNYQNSNEDHLFAESINMFQQSPLIGVLKSMDFRSRPLEYYNDVYDDDYNEIGLPYSHKTTYFALDILYNIGMLYDFLKLKAEAKAEAKEKGEGRREKGKGKQGKGRREKGNKEKGEGKREKG